MALIDTITQLGTTIINFTSAKITGALDALTEYITDNTSGESGDISGGGSSVEIVTTISADSTDEQVPSAKCMWDLIGDVETLLSEV